MSLIPVGREVVRANVLIGMDRASLPDLDSILLSEDFQAESAHHHMPPKISKSDGT